MDNEPTINGMSAEALCQLLQEFGFSALLVTGGDGEQAIRSSAGGWYFIVVPYRTGSGRTYSSCGLYSALGDITITPDFANLWNEKTRFTKACCDPENNPALEFDIMLAGVTKSYLRRCLSIWESQLPQYFEAAGRSSELG